MPRLFVFVVAVLLVPFSYSPSRVVAVRLLLHSSKRLARVVDLSLSMRRILVITTPRLFKNGASDSLRQATYCLSFCCCDNSLNKLLVFVGRVNFHFFIIQRHRIFLWVSRYFRVRRQFVTVAYPILAVSTSTLCALGCTIWSIARLASWRELSQIIKLCSLDREIRTWPLPTSPPSWMHLHRLFVSMLRVRCQSLAEIGAKLRHRLRCL